MLDIAAIACMSKNGVIGDSRIAKGLPWDCPEDLARFRSLTLGHVVVMGSRTFRHIGRPLPGRENVVLSRTMPPGTHHHNGNPYHVFGSFKALLLHYGANDAERLRGRTIWVIGGAEIYKATMSYWRRLELTVLGEDFAGDAAMPEYGFMVDAVVEEVPFEDGWFISYSMKAPASDGQ